VIDTSSQAITCPLDGCEWVLDQPAPDVSEGALASVFGSGVMAAVARSRHAQDVEDTLRAHYRTHGAADFLRTITGLRAERDSERVLRLGFEQAHLSAVQDLLQAQTAVERVRKLHAERPAGYCWACTGQGDAPVQWPCRTLLALDSTAAPQRELEAADEPTTKPASLGHGDPVVLVDGLSGGIALTHVQPIGEAVTTDG
jgi:hypothetical protein